MNRPRRGYALIELLLVMSALVVVLGLCVGLIQVLMRLDRVARDHLAEATTRDRLARAFRIDVRSATDAKTSSGRAGTSDRLELTGDDGRVVNYSVREESLVRDEFEGKRQVRHERYRLSSPAVVRFERRDDHGTLFVVLELTRKPSAPGNGPPRKAEYVALLGRDARLARRQEEAR